MRSRLAGQIRVQDLVGVLVEQNWAICYGRVSSGPDARLQEGAVASAGDRIMARMNVNDEAIANRDVYQVDKVNPDGSVLARLLERDTTLSGPRVLDAGYLQGECHLAYRCTSYAVQGTTFTGNGYALVRPGDDAKYLYTAMNRGQEANFAFAIAEQPQLETGKPQPAPEVARSRMLAAEQSGDDLGADLGGRSGAGVLAQVLARGNRELSATEAMERGFSHVDSLAVLSRGSGACRG